jgi:Ca2+-binding RTX toxin-like protein
MAVINGTSAADTLNGTPDADVINGFGGNDVLNGEGGNDQLDGGTGDDLMSGGADDDHYLVDSAGDVVTEQSGEGFDGIQTSVDFRLRAGQSVEWLATLGVATTTNLRLTGNEIANQLIGNNGNNYLDGGAGADWSIGHLGDDLYVVDNAGDAVTELGGEGFDGIQTSVDYALAAGQSIEWLGTWGVATTTNLRLFGNEVANQLIGNNGNNYLDGGAGADWLIGQLGDDWYVVDGVGDAVTELAGEGFDAIQTSVDYVLAAGQSVEWLGTWGVATTANLRLTGNEIANQLIGNNGNNYLDGGAGADRMIGHLGDDLYIVDNAGDAVTELAGEGFDGLQTSVDYVLQAGQSVEWLATLGIATTTNARLVGNEIANQLFGNAGDNFIDGGGGVDRMTGSLGDDTYVVDNSADVVIELAGEGDADRIETVVDYALAAGQSIEILGVFLFRFSGNVRLFGNEIDNILVGNWGNDLLDGGAGADDMRGDRGDDLYIVDNGGDLVIEGGTGSGRDLSQGFDGVQTSVDYVLPAGQFIDWLATLDVATTTNLRLTGNERSQQLFGNNGDNFLDGKGGPDALRGYGGADTFAFTTALIVEIPGGAIDLVDLILDFEAGLDKIALDDAVFAGVTSGNLASVFVVGTQAQDADDRIIYDQATGALYYDSDGNGSAAAPVQFADLVTAAFGVPSRPAPLLTASDFTVI